MFVRCGVEVEKDRQGLNVERPYLQVQNEFKEILCLK